MRDLEKIKKELYIWNRLSIYLPVLFTVILLDLYILQIFEKEILFYVGAILYFITAIVWWFWTMKNIIFLANLLKQSQKDLEVIIHEVKSIKKELF